MSTWDGRPPNPERTTAHWIEDKSLKHVCCVVWCHSMQQWHDMAVQMPPRAAAKWWRYLGPCLTPDDIAARERAARNQGRREAAAAVARIANEHGWQECCGIGEGYPPECCNRPVLVLELRQAENAILALIEQEPQ